MIRAIAALLVTSLCGHACTIRPAEEDYPAKIAAVRAAKDDSFKNDKESPVPDDKKATLIPLVYYPIDENFAVPATLEPAAERTRITVPTSTGKIRDLERIGALKFSLNGKPLRLTAFIDVESPQVNRLFVPFADQTSGSETYAAGRYMELDPTATGIYVVDFNIAYNPYCYYSPEFDCPYPPKENRLDVPIRAGERVHTANAGPAGDRF
ncbi:MAG TPA: DUF1684 domain-containing protein [Vicinamibacterales bacterium]|nr:DUF1684 domain-containing protein [Vicinamibacterales bacterium]